VSGRVHELFVEGVGFWTSRLPGWEQARAVLRAEAPPPEAAAARPAPALLPPAERRRAPDTVAVALEVAARACASARRDPRTLASVFASTHGDLAISDSICDTLARAPLQISPTRFHNSVHNAPAGYWSIGTGSVKPYTAVTARYYTFGAGLLESAVQALSENAPVLYVAYDIEARGPLATMQPSRGVLAAALVLAPQSNARSLVRLALEVRETKNAHSTPARAHNAALVEGNAMAGCLAFFEALADAVECSVVQALSPDLALHAHMMAVGSQEDRHPELLERAQ
jgi:Beta-ketoacyl synthase, N-terminal domain